MMPRKTIFQTLKKFSALSLILALVLTTLAGCGESAEEAAPPSVEPIAAPASSGENTGNASEENGPVDEKSPEQGSSGENSSKDGQANLSDQNVPNQSDSASAPQSDSELDGNVRTVGTDSFVVSQSFTMPSEDSENAEIMISPAEGSEDEILITVHITESTVYKIHTVKNGGVNGDSDVEKTEGSFADIQEKTSVNAKGYYENGDFWADTIIIFRFV